jgi:uncharacterized protein (TIGR03086 family)
LHFHEDVAVLDGTREALVANVIGQIDRAVEATGRVVAGVGDDRLTDPTMCTDWDVRALLNHTVGGMRIFTAQLTGTDAGADHEADWLRTDPRAAYTAAAAADHAAWHLPGALAITVHISLGALPGPLAAVIHLTELCAHGADLAVATGREAALDEDLCEELLATMHGMGGIDAYRMPGVFGPEAPAPAGALPHRRLLAYLGRPVDGVPG